MMPYQGDFAFGQVVDFKFTSRDSTGTPSTLSTNAVPLAIYRDNGTSEFSHGLSLTTDIDGRVGYNHVRITTASSATQFLEGHEFSVAFINGQVSPITIVGEEAGSFSISNRFGGAVFYGLLQAAPSTSQVSLPSTASTTNDLYNGVALYLATGPGQGQARYVSDYTGATFSAQLDQALGTAATSATTVVGYPSGPAASEVSANVRKVNNVQITGDGSGTPFNV